MFGDIGSVDHAPGSKLQEAKRTILMRILIVEDEKRMAAVLKKGLEAENHRVTLAYDGRTGLDLAEATEFDVVVLDLMLPVIDGFEVARRLRKNGNQTPILMLTARDAAPDIVKGLDLGADDYVTKPFSFDVFLARLRSVARSGSSGRPTSHLGWTHIHLGSLADAGRHLSQPQSAGHLCSAAVWGDVAGANGRLPRLLLRVSLPLYHRDRKCGVEIHPESQPGHCLRQSASRMVVRFLVGFMWLGPPSLSSLQLWPSR